MHRRRIFTKLENIRKRHLAATKGIRTGEIGVVHPKRPVRSARLQYRAGARYRHARRRGCGIDDGGGGSGKRDGTVLLDLRLVFVGHGNGGYCSVFFYLQRYTDNA